MVKPQTIPCLEIANASNVFPFSFGIQCGFGCGTSFIRTVKFANLFFAIHEISLEILNYRRVTSDLVITFDHSHGQFGLVAFRK